MRPLLFYGQIFYGTLEPVAAEQGEASTGVVEVATTSARVERIQGGKKLEYKQWCAEAKYAIEEVKDYHEPTIPENKCNHSREQCASDGVYFRVIDTYG